MDFVALFNSSRHTHSLPKQIADSNQQGCDGGRLYFDGCSSIFINGDCVAQGTQFAIRDVEVITATVDLEDVRSYRASIPSRGVQADRAKKLPRVLVNFNLSNNTARLAAQSPPMMIKFHRFEEEIAYGPACWLWDYLRRSGGSGFFLPLSGGADSSATAALVSIMCRLVFADIQRGDNPQALEDVRRLVGEKPESKYVPANHRELCNFILHSCYMGIFLCSLGARTG